MVAVTSETFILQESQSHNLQHLTLQQIQHLILRQIQHLIPHQVYNIDFVYLGVFDNPLAFHKQHYIHTVISNILASSTTTVPGKETPQGTIDIKEIDDAVRKESHLWLYIHNWD